MEKGEKRRKEKKKVEGKRELAGWRKGKRRKWRSGEWGGGSRWG